LVDVRLKTTITEKGKNCRRNDSREGGDSKKPTNRKGEWVTPY